jgi:hypothetical protein
MYLIQAIKARIPEKKAPMSLGDTVIMACVGGFLSGATIAVGRSLVEHREFVRLARRSLYLGPPNIKAAIFILLLFVDFAAVAAWIRSMTKRRAQETPRRYPDYVVVVLGIVGTVLTIMNPSWEIVYWWGSLSACAFFIAVFAFVTGLFTNDMKAPRLASLCFAISNVLPAIVFVRLFYRF